MGFQGNGLIEYKSFPLGSKPQLERFNWLFILGVLAWFSLLYCRSLQKHKYRRMDIYFLPHVDLGINVSWETHFPKTGVFAQ